MKEKVKKIKAELTTENIVALIILIVGFTILLVFLIGFNFGDEIDKWVCKSSVLLKATSKQIVGIKGFSTSLDCHTRYICITKDNKCDKNNAAKIVKKVSSSDEIFEILADELSNCWSMFGEGKMDYFESFDIINLNGKMYCSLCSEIFFDEDLKEIKDENNYFDKDNTGKVIGLNQTKFYSYLSKTKIQNSDKTYLNYLYGIKSFSDLRASMGASNKVITKDNLLNNEVQSLSFPPINFSKDYFILLGAVDSSWNLLDFFSSKGGAIFGATLGLVAIAWTGGVATPVVVYFVGALVGAGVGEGVQQGTNFLIQEVIFSRDQQSEGNQGFTLKFIGPNLIEAESGKIKNLKCTQINTLA